MTTSRRSFLRIAGLAAASTLAMPHHARAGRAASPLQRFVATLRPLFEGKEGTSRSAVAYLRALKEPSGGSRV